MGWSWKGFLSTAILESRLSVVDEFEIRFVGNQDRFVAAQFRADVKGRLVDFHDSSIRLAVSEAFWRALYFFKLFFDLCQQSVILTHLVVDLLCY